MSHSFPPRLVAATLCLLCTGQLAAAGEVELGWRDRFDGEDHRNDYGEALAIDSAGQVYVTGFTFIQEQPNLFSPRYLTIKYDMDGNRLWTRTWEVGQRSDAHDMAIDQQDNILVTGAVGSSDWGTIKYDAAGNLLWSAIYPTDTPFVEGPTAVNVDGSGNVYVAGTELSLNSATVIKYDPDGNQLWLRRYEGTGEGASVNALAVSEQGDVYLAGSVVDPDFSSQFAVIKYDTEGNQQWVRSYGSFSGGAVDIAEDIVIDGSGAIVASGYFGANSLESQDLATYKFAPDGTLLWSDRYGDPTRDAEFGASLTVDSLGNVIVAATSEDSSFVGDLLLLKYSADGVLRWNRLWDGATGEYDFATDVAVDDSDRIYAIGSGGFFNYYFTVKYDGAGNEGWTQRYNGPSGGSIPWSVALGKDRGVYLTGDSDSFQNELDIVTSKYVQPMALAAPVPGLAGETNTLVLSWPEDGETIVFVGSGKRGSRPVPTCTDTTLDVAGGAVLGQAVVSRQRATLDLEVPPGAAGKTVYLQAISVTSCVVSNRVAYTFP